MKRRPISPFSLSFLDIMFCGFGAVVLLVLILNTDTVKARNQTFNDLSADVIRLEQQVMTGEDDQVLARNALAAVEAEQQVTRGESERVIEAIKDLKIQIATLEKQTLASRSHINELSSDLKNLDSEQRRQGAPVLAAGDQGDKVRRFQGEGDRQYLTGLKVGGKRVLILVDASASMLDETIINVVRRRNMDDASKRNAAKWRRALATADWLISNLPPAARFQLYSFNTQAQPTMAGSAGRWLRANRHEEVEAAVTGLHALIPAGGTSLYKALAVAGKLSARPDNILLITDGLPTQGRSAPGSTTVSAKARLRHFQSAVQSLPRGIPVNTILLPMEGDAWAAAAYWKLAIDTRGSFLTPARDWP